MRNFFAKYKGSLLVLVIVLIGFWAYSTFGPEVQKVQINRSLEAEELFVMLDRINSIKLDNSLFEDDDFTILQDFETEVPAGLAGRSNPFAPTGGDTGGVLVEPSYKVLPVSPAESFLNATTSPDS